jgi:two-component system, NarL family, nitrate/nitrite response regulator NarL
MKMQTFKIFLVDPSQLLREGLRRLLDDPAFAVGGESATLAEALGKIAADEAPDLLLLDYSADDKQRLEDIRALRQRCPQMRVVVLTDVLSSVSLAQCFDAGADGYLVKNISSVALKQSLRLVMIGEKVFPTNLASLLVNGKVEARPHAINDAGMAGLSEREIQILQCLLNGYPNKVIAHHLDITESTVKVHLKGILRKIRATNRTQAAIWALNRGLGASAPTPTNNRGAASATLSAAKAAEERETGTAAASQRVARLERL